MVDPDKGEIFYAGPQIPNYAVSVQESGRKTFAVPCEIENDVNCAELAEVMSRGAGRSRLCDLFDGGTGIGGFVCWWMVRFSWF